MKFADCPRLVRAIGDAVAADPDATAAVLRCLPERHALRVSVQFGPALGWADFPAALDHRDDGHLGEAVVAGMAAIRRQAGLELAVAAGR